MGNHKFRLSNMIPNTWFYKLRDMKRGSQKSQRNPKTTSKRSNSQAHTSSSSSSSSSSSCSSSSSSSSPTPPIPPPPPPPPPSNTFYLPNRSSYYFPSKERNITNPTVPPRKSKKFSAKKPTRASPKPPSSVSSSASNKPEPGPDTRPFDRDVYTEDDDHRRKTIAAKSLQPETFSVTTSATDIVFDVAKPAKLPPILTKPTRMQADKPRSDHKRRSPSRIRLRLSRTKTEAKQRKGLMESFVVVKSSSDPQRDFRESMVEMIVENNIRSSKDLEELLACYLALNSREYHPVIVQSFEQIWIHLNNDALH